VYKYLFITQLHTSTYTHVHKCSTPVDDEQQQKLFSFCFPILLLALNKRTDQQTDCSQIRLA
jgi:hypothetical protein